MTRTMHNCIKTLLDHDNSSHKLNLDRIAFHQGFDAVEFRAAFLAAETERSMRPRNYEEMDK